MGEVYSARDSELGRLVALKFLSGELTAHHTRVKRFIQEAKAASALNHPNILTVYEIGRTDDATFIATEFVDGVSNALHEIRIFGAAAAEDDFIRHRPEMQTVVERE